MIDGSSLRPCRGEIWLVNLDPTIGDEIKKKRPCLVVNSDSIGKLRLRLVAPITEWKNAFLHNLWHVRIDPDKNNNLNKASAIDRVWRLHQGQSGATALLEALFEDYKNNIADLAAVADGLEG